MYPNNTSFVSTTINSDTNLVLSNRYQTLCLANEKETQCFSNTLKDNTNENIILFVRLSEVSTCKSW